jgi:hypothetical protein
MILTAWADLKENRGGNSPRAGNRWGKIKKGIRDINRKSLISPEANKNFTSWLFSSLLF